jgi:hypothetical protein
MCIPTPLQIFSSPLRFSPLPPPPPPCSLHSSADTSETLLVHCLLFLRPQSFDLTIATNKSSQQKQNQTYSLSLSLSLSLSMCCTTTVALLLPSTAPSYLAALALACLLACLQGDASYYRTLNVFVHVLSCVFGFAKL